jgi:hypothetical protein
MNKEFDTFISYAKEDEKLAAEIAGAIKSHGFSVWYAPLSLKIGEKLFNSIEEGINKSKSCLLLISPEYLNKRWTTFEMDTFLRQSVERDKKLFPIWHNVSREDVENKHPSLANIVALPTTTQFNDLIKSLVNELGQYAPTMCVTPCYQEPNSRFLSGRGELRMGTEEGPATSLWELIIHLKENQYPICCNGELIDRKQIIYRAASSMPHIPDVVKDFVGEEGYKRIWEICKNYGYDPEIFE